jgi:4-hydroxy-3-methylbut-2-enyl diphosphate reductase
MESTYFRRGFGLKSEIEVQLTADYHSTVVEVLRRQQHRLVVGPLTFRLAREFGFCYGVDRAVDYAYETRLKFPDRTLYLVGEIIHNPHVNQKLRDMGVNFLARGEMGEFDFSSIGADDVVILPAFGVTTAMLKQLERRGCALIDTTCGSVLNVWKNVRRYCEGRYTSIIHGKAWHEETQATASQAVEYGGRYLVMLNHDEAQIVCDYIRTGGDREAFLSHFSTAASAGFDPDRDLCRIGLANQTTMLMSESLAIGDMLKAAMLDRYGAERLAEHFEAFDTICSATQDRQDAVVALLEEHPVDLVIVIGGYNSSNTCNLARICAASRPTFHIADPDGLASPQQIRHRPIGGGAEVITQGWLPENGPISLGLTSGASTPDNLVGAAIARITEFAATH